jgi:hypothetical protein
VELGGGGRPAPLGYLEASCFALSGIREDGAGLETGGRDTRAGAYDLVLEIAPPSLYSDLFNFAMPVRDSEDTCLITPVMKYLNRRTCEDSGDTCQITLLSDLA